MISEVLFFIIFLLVCYLYGTHTFDYFEKRHVKHPKPVPFLGNQWSFFLGKHLVSGMESSYNQFPDEKYTGFYDFLQPWIWIKDNNLIKQVGVKDFESFLDHRTVLNENIDTLYSQLLIALRGKKWKEMRGIMSPAFTSSKIKGMMPLINNCCHQLIAYLKERIDENGGSIMEMDTKDVFTRYANDVIASVAFGFKVDSLQDKNNDFYKMGIKLTDLNFVFYFKYIFNYLFPSVIKFFKIPLMDKTAGNYFKNVIKQAMKEREEKGIKRADLIDLLVEARKGSIKVADQKSSQKDEDNLDYQHFNKTNWTDDELTAQALIFFLAGFESVSTFLSFATYRLATRHDVQKKLFEEVDSFKDSENFYENIMSMKYMNMFVSECLRLYPTLPFADRECTKPYVLPPPNDQSSKPVHVFPGDNIFIPIRSIQRDPNYFPDPLHFDPERFSDENKNNIKPFTFIPFGVGPRQCLGRRFALMEIKCILYFLVSNFSFVPCSKTRDPTGLPTKVVSLVPKEGIWVGITKRSNS